MTEAPVFLAPRAKVEPLVARWYAWPHLVSALQLGLNLEYRYLPLLRSFLANPGVHAAASRDPGMYGGPYIDLPEAAAGDIRALAEAAAAASVSLREVAAELRALQIALPQTARGGGMEDLYTRLPPALRGLAEFSYDCHGRPGVRLFEELLNRSLDAAASDLQEISIINIRDHERAFFLNTPRLRSAERLDCRLPFRSEAMERLGRLRITPAPIDTVCAWLGLDPADRDRLRPFVTEVPPTRSAPDFAQDGVRVRYFGHACVLVQTRQVSVLFDPLMAWELDCPEASFTFHDLPDHIDFVVLTHNHQDHVSVETLLQLRGRVGRVLVPRHNAASDADPSLRLMLESLGFASVQALDPLATVPLPGGQLTALPFLGEHADLDIHSKQGLVVELQGVRLLFLADSRCLDPMLYRRLSGLIGPVEALFIGMECHGAPLTWLYGPYLSEPPLRRHDESRRLSGSDSAQAWAVVEELNCQRVFVYAMGQEPWLRHILGLAYQPDSFQLVESDRFVAAARAAGLPAERLRGCCEFRFGAAQSVSASLAVEAS